MKIFKYPAPIADDFVVRMPRVAKVLTVQIQRGEPQIWAMVDDDGSLEPHRFQWVGTGHTMSEPDGVYVGTVQLMNGGLVFHLFELL